MDSPELSHRVAQSPHSLSVVVPSATHEGSEVNEIGDALPVRPNAAESSYRPSLAMPDPGERVASSPRLVINADGGSRSGSSRNGRSTIEGVMPFPPSSAVSGQASVPSQSSSVMMNLETPRPPGDFEWDERTGKPDGTIGRDGKPNQREG